MAVDLDFDACQFVHGERGSYERTAAADIDDITIGRAAGATAKSHGNRHGGTFTPPMFHGPLPTASFRMGVDWRAGAQPAIRENR